MKRMRLVSTWLALSWGAATLAAGGGIVNYLEHSPIFASAGQPTAAQLEELERRGFERIVYIAFSDQRNALEHEDPS